MTRSLCLTWTCLVVAAVLSSPLLLATQVHAIEVECIADSQYKRLYQIFDGDPAKFAAYLEIDTGTRRLPDPEACRSALVKGGIGEKASQPDISATTRLPCRRSPTL